MTFVCMLIGLIGAPFFLSADPLFQAIGGLLFVAHSVTDGCDGELARLTYTESRFGGLFDFASDNLVHVCVFGCMAWGWHINTGSPWPLYFGLGALVGTIGSAAAVYWLTMRKKSGSGPLYTSVSASDDNKKLSKMLNDLSRRDFIYLVFAMSVVGQAHWFVAMTGIGAPIFLILVIVLAVKNARPSQGVKP
jgi:phosphatidylglycerophosphate synthase